MSMFPGAGAQVYYNEAGEPLGWDYPSDGPYEDDQDLDDDEDDHEEDDDEPLDDFDDAARQWRDEFRQPEGRK